MREFLLTFFISLTGAILGAIFYQSFFYPKYYVLDLKALYTLGARPEEVEEIIATYEGMIIDREVVIYAPKSVRDITQEVLRKLAKKR